VILGEHAKTLISRIWAPALLFLAFLTAITVGGDAIQNLTEKTPDRIGAFISHAIDIGALLSAAFLINRVVDTAIWEMLVARGTNIKVPKLLRQLSALIIYGCAIIGIAGFVFAQSVTALITTSSAVGLLVGFALRSLILDAFSGIAINFEQPFSVGHFIQIRGRSTEPIMGLVQEVKWRTTRLLTLENDIIVIPNGILAESVILNRSAPNLICEFEQTIKLDFSVEPERALRVLGSAVHMAVAEGGALAHPEPKVLLDVVDETGVHYRISYAVDPTKTSPRIAKHILLTHVLDNLHLAGLTPALPKQDMFVARMPDRRLDYENLTHRATQLGRIDLFSEFDAAALDLLARQAKVRVVPAGSVVIEQDDDMGTSMDDKGTSMHGMFVVVEGTLGVQVRGPDGISREVGYLQPGAFFGEMSVLTGEKRSATVYAVGEAVLYEITKEHIASLLDSNPEIAAILSQTVAERQLRNSAAAAQLPPEVRAEQQKNMVEQLMRSMTTFFGRIFRAA
jgi:small-conductance mechanosensitive channel/CRP-like cAMP-binding protein